MSVDIFIKTYHTDFQWLVYCLKSIKKFATGFRKIVIVSDNDGHVIPIDYLFDTCEVHYTSLPEKEPEVVEHGIGYLWQQAVKLNWVDYTDADAVLIMDSDEMLTVPITPESFKTNGKFSWYFREWKDAGTGICWKPPTDFILKLDTNYEAMAITGFILQRETTFALHKFLCNLHETETIWDIFVKNNTKTASEFNIFGSFIHHFDRNEYNKITNYNRENCINFSIKKAWSWGGISDEEKEKMESILND